MIPYKDLNSQDKVCFLLLFILLLYMYYIIFYYLKVLLLLLYGCVNIMLYYL